MAPARVVVKLNPLTERDGLFVIDPLGDGNCGWTVILGILVALYDTFGVVTGLGIPESADRLRILIRGKGEGSKKPSAVKEATSFDIGVALGVIRRKCLDRLLDFGDDHPLDFVNSISIEHSRDSGNSGHWFATVTCPSIAHAFYSTTRPERILPLLCLHEHFATAHTEQIAIEQEEIARLYGVDGPLSDTPAPATTRAAEPEAKKMKGKKPSQVSGATSSRRQQVSPADQLATDLEIARLLKEDEGKRRAQEASDASLAAWMGREKQK